MIRSTSSNCGVGQRPIGPIQESTFLENGGEPTSDESTDTAPEVQFLQELRADPADHSCELCNKGSFLVNKLWSFGGVLDSKKKYACDLCEQGFIRKCDLTRHKEEHEKGLVVIPQRNPLSVYCGVCFKGFKNEKSLSAHEKRQHSAQMAHLCQVCKMKFTNFRLFTKHCLLHTTNSRKKFSCKTCKSHFMYKKSLQQHKCAVKK